MQLHDKMKISTKILLTLQAVCLSYTLLIGWQSFNATREVLRQESFQKLIAIRDNRRRLVEDYFAKLTANIQIYSRSKSFVEAASRLKQAMALLPAEARDLGLKTGEQQALLNDYYQNHFAPALAQRTDEFAAKVPHAGFSDRTILLQTRYLPGLRERQPAGFAQRFPKTAYSRVHDEFDPFFQTIIDKKCLQDLLIVDSRSGDILYSVKKEVDFATNLAGGPFEHSSLGGLFQQVRAADGVDVVHCSDFEHYCPSLHVPAAFMASPIFQGEQQIGVLIFKISLAEIDRIMTDDKNWRAAGLGETGETYLVGEDLTLRNNSRFFLEDPQGFISRSPGYNIASPVAEEIQRDNTTILLLNVGNDAIRNAFAGKSATAVMEDYRRQSVLASYAPLALPDVRWALVAKIDAREAFAQVGQVRNHLLLVMLLLSLSVVPVGLFLARTLTRPLQRLRQAVNQIGSGDFSQRLVSQSNDELADLVAAYNRMADRLDETTVSLDYFDNILSSINDILLIIELDPQTKRVNIVDANRAAVRQLGYERQELPDLPYAKLFADQAKMQALVERMVGRLLAGEPLAGADIHYVSRQGKPLPVVFAASLLSRNEAGLLYVVTAAQDISALKEVEGRHIKANRALRVLSSCNKSLTRATDAGQFMDELCRVITGIGGYTLVWIGLAEHDEAKTVRPVAQSGCGQEYLEAIRVSWADNELGRGPTGTAVRTGRPQIARHILTDPNYEPWRAKALAHGYQSSVALPVREGEAVIGALNIYAAEPEAFDPAELELLEEVATDLAYGLKSIALHQQNRLAAAELARSEQRFRVMFESATDAIVLVGVEDGVISAANKRAEELFGLAGSMLAGRDIQEVIRGFDLAGVSRIEGTVGLLSGTRRRDHTIILPDGSTVPVEISCSCFELDERPVLQLAIRDIRERKRSEEELRKLATIIESSYDFVGMSDLNGQMYYLNRAGRSLVGLGSQAAVRQAAITDFLSGEDYRYFQDKIAPAMMEAGYWQGEFRLRHFKTGRMLPVDMNVFLIKDEESGQPMAQATIIRDLTERKQAERQLRQAQKMEAIGTLAGGIAHDFNNILSAVIGYTELALHASAKDSNIASYLGEVKKAGKRATELVRQILAFSRQSESELKPLRLQSVVKETVKLLRGALPSTIEMRQNIDEKCRPILADATQIHQVIMNLCTNGYQAMREKGGILEIGLQEVELDDEFVDLHPGMSPGLHVKLTVRDTGHGMDQTTMDRIFEPYFSTKKQGEGTGLGLATVHGIVQSHQGAITVSSKPGEGAQFCVYLPVPEQPVQPAMEPGQWARPPRLEGHFLVVDDELPVLEFLHNALTMLGGEVSTCNSSLEAQALFMADPARFDMMITDQTMPGLTGIDLARQVLRLRPDMPIILATGYSETVDEEQARAAGIRKFLMKPFTIKNLADSVIEVMGEG